MKRLSVEVYRHNYGENYDPTNGGISSKRNSLMLFFDCTREECEKYCEDKRYKKHEVLILVRRDFYDGEYLYAEPLVRPEGFVGPMFGGNFVWSCDSRFSEVCHYPIPVHDRFETKELNNILSI